MCALRGGVVGHKDTELERVELVRERGVERCEGVGDGEEGRNSGGAEDLFTRGYPPPEGRGGEEEFRLSKLDLLGRADRVGVLLRLSDVCSVLYVDLLSIKLR